MNPFVEKLVQPVVKRSLSIANTGIENSRRVAETSSDWLSSSTDSVAVVSDKVLKLNRVSHDAVAQLLSNQANMFAGTIDALATRLDVASHSKNVRGLVRDQLELMPESRDRITRDTRKMMNIFVNTGVELKELATETVTELGGRGEKLVKKTAKTAKSAAKTARKTAKKTVRKASKKTAKVAKTTRKKVAKKTAKKTTRKTSRRS